MASKNQQPSLRIHSGAWRGRKLLPPPGSGTRPITGLAKKSLFGMLTGRLDQALVLDLYSGTGTLGLEALSHGAKRCAFAERRRPVLARLRRNITLCDADEASLVWEGDVERHLGAWLDELGEPVDIAFVDPPFPATRTWDWNRLAEKMFTPLANALSEAGLVVLRLPVDVLPPESLGSLDKERSREYGDMTISFYGRRSQESRHGGPSAGDSSQENSF